MRFTYVGLVLVIVATAFAQLPSPALAQPAGAGTTLDYEFFKDQVQPIFLAERPGGR